MILWSFEVVLVFRDDDRRQRSPVLSRRRICYEIYMDSRGFPRPRRRLCYSLYRGYLWQIAYTLSTALRDPSAHVSRAFYNYSTRKRTYLLHWTSSAMKIAESKLIAMEKILKSGIVTTKRDWSDTFIMYTNHRVFLIRHLLGIGITDIRRRKRCRLNNPSNIPSPLCSGLERLNSCSWP